MNKDRDLTPAEEAEIGKQLDCPDDFERGRRAGLEEAARRLDAEALEARKMAVLAARADDAASEAGYTALAYSYENSAAAVRSLGRPK